MNAHANVRALDPSARRRLFPTGFGKSETHGHPLREGVLNPSARAGQPYDTIDPAGIVRLLKNPPSVPKDNAQWFIPSSYCDFDARSHAAQREHGTFWWLILDVDDNDLALGEIEAALTSVVPGCRQLIYATRSSMPDGRRWRALVPLDEPVAGADYHDTADAFFDLLEEATAGALIPCRGLDRAAQLVYLPNRGEHYEHAIRKAGGSLDLTDHPIIRRREETRRKRAEADAAAKAQRERRHGERAARGTGDEETPIEHFNRNHSIAGLLEKYDYTQAGQSIDWRSRYQSSGSFATRAFEEYWISLSASDAAEGLGSASRSGMRFGDAFDLFAYYEYAGDRKAAIKDYADRAGISALTFSWGAGGSAERNGDASQPNRDEEPPDGRAEPEPDEPSVGEKSEPFPPKMVMGPRGKPRWCQENACLILEHHADWKGVLAYDEFTSETLLLRPRIKNTPVELPAARVRRGRPDQRTALVQPQRLPGRNSQHPCRRYRRGGAAADHLSCPPLSRTPRVG